LNLIESWASIALTWCSCWVRNISIYIITNTRKGSLDSVIVNRWGKSFIANTNTRCVVGRISRASLVRWGASKRCGSDLVSDVGVGIEIADTSVIGRVHDWALNTAYKRISRLRSFEICRFALTSCSCGSSNISVDGVTNTSLTDVRTRSNFGD